MSIMEVFVSDRELREYCQQHAHKILLDVVPDFSQHLQTAVLTSSSADLGAKLRVNESSLRRTAHHEQKIHSDLEYVGECVHMAA